MCEEISCSSFYAKEFDVIVQVFSLYGPIKFFAILYPKSLANLVVEVGTRHNNQIQVWKFRIVLQATVDHHGPSMYSGHYTASINCWENTQQNKNKRKRTIKSKTKQTNKQIFHYHDSKIKEFEMIDTKNSSTAYVAIYKLIK